MLDKEWATGKREVIFTGVRGVLVLVGLEGLPCITSLTMSVYELRPHDASCCNNATEYIQ